MKRIMMLVLLAVCFSFNAYAFGLGDLAKKATQAIEQKQKADEDAKRSEAKRVEDEQKAEERAQAERDREQAREQAKAERERKSEEIRAQNKRNEEARRQKAAEEREARKLAIEQRERERAEAEAEGNKAKAEADAKFAREMAAMEERQAKEEAEAEKRREQAMIEQQKAEADMATWRDTNMATLKAYRWNGIGAGGFYAEQTVKDLKVWARDYTQRTEPAEFKSQVMTALEGYVEYTLECTAMQLGEDDPTWKETVKAKIPANKGREWAACMYKTQTKLP